MKIAKMSIFVLVRKIANSPSDERIQILQESCKMIQNFQDSCKNLARYQSRQKNKSGYKCFRKHLWSKLLFIKQITKPNSMKKKISSDSKTCKNLASFWILENLFVCNWWLKLTETQMKWLISVFLISKTELNWLFWTRLLNEKSCKNLASFLQDFEFKIKFRTNN